MSSDDKNDKLIRRQHPRATCDANVHKHRRLCACDNFAVESDTCFTERSLQVGSSDRRCHLLATRADSPDAGPNATGKQLPFSHTPALMLVRYGLVNAPVVPAFADAHITDARARRLRVIGRFRCIGDRSEILNRLMPPCGGSHAFRLVCTFICALWPRYFPPFFLTSFSES